MRKINKHSVLKQVRDSGYWSGWIAPSKTSLAHINSGWHIGMQIIISGHREETGEWSYIVDNDSDIYGADSLSDIINNFEYYNCNSELGYRVGFYEEVGR